MTNLVEGGLVLEFTSWLLSLGLKKGSLRQMFYPALEAWGSVENHIDAKAPSPKILMQLVWEGAWVLVVLKALRCY